MATIRTEPRVVNLELRRLEKLAEERLIEMRRQLTGDVEAAREALRMLITDRFVMTPRDTPDGRRYEITAKTAIGSVFGLERSAQRRTGALALGRAKYPCRSVPT